MNQYEFHEAANVFPFLQGREFQDLKADIKENGIQIPVVVYQGKILDGRNRYKAAYQLIEDGYSVDVPFEEFGGTEEEALQYVISTNLHRRHLSESQRAMIAGRIANLSHGGNRNDTEMLHSTTQSEAARALNVSPRSVKRGKAVLKSGTETLIQKVDAGDLPVATAEEIARLEKQEQEQVLELSEKEILAKAKEIRTRRGKAILEKRVKKLAAFSDATAELPTGRQYPVILADPPWKYEYAKSHNREIENHYPTMELEDICNLRIPDLCTDPAILFLWVTSPKLAEGLSVLEAWGFTYRSSLVWVKPHIGMGVWVRCRHEFVLIGIRGAFPAPPESARFDSVIEAPKIEHSVKPEVLQIHIEQMFPELQKIELFARTQREGWDCWGNEVKEDKF